MISWPQMERNAAVREAVEAWAKRGLARADAGARETLDLLFPDPRRVRGPALRTLLFALTLTAVLGLFALLALGSDSGSAAKVLCLLFGIALALLCDWRVRLLPRAVTGVEAACSLLAIGFLAAWVLTILDDVSAGFVNTARLFLLSLAGLLAAAAWRWGYSLYGALAALSLFSALAAVEGGRWAVLLAGSLAVPLLLRLSESRHPVPAQRQAAALALAVTLVAVYASVNVVSIDSGWFERLVDRSRAALGGELGVRAFSLAATVLLPALCVGFGARTRRLLFLRVGLLLAVGSLASIRYYFHVAPPWVILAGAGTLAIATALILRRWLDAGPARERHGFTADPAFQDERHSGIARGVAVVATFAPHAATPAPAEPSGFKGEGGRMGGGGASGDF